MLAAGCSAPAPITTPSTSASMPNATSTAMPSSTPTPTPSAAPSPSPTPSAEPSVIAKPIPAAASAKTTAAKKKRKPTVTMTCTPTVSQESGDPLLRITWRVKDPDNVGWKISYSYTNDFGQNGGSAKGRGNKTWSETDYGMGLDQLGPGCSATVE